ncbi:MAG: type 1 glutamine amidotransferase [Candidatus Saccharibacteria bacterium]|nr:type 1 glutamine amidotransferase [Candidatus Saccharibacteria bacterium]
MKILVVNNHTQHLQYLTAALAGHELDIVVYEPGVILDESGADLVVLSGGGGEGLEINDSHQSGKLWYQDEMEFIMRCSKPIIGICMGFEVIARAYGSKVEEMSSLIMGFRKLTTTKGGKTAFSKESLRQYEAHQWHVEDINTKEFDVLAHSASGLEIIKHKRRPVLATQFHPEKGGTLKLKHLLSSAF